MTDQVPIYDSLSRDKEVKTTQRRLLKVVKNLDENTQIIAKNIIENLAFITVTCKELRTIVIRDGYIEEYQNGENQRGFKRSVALDQYNTAVKNHSMYLQQLIKLVPNMELEDDLDELLNKKKKIQTPKS